MARPLHSWILASRSALAWNHLEFVPLLAQLSHIQALDLFWLLPRSRVWSHDVHTASHFLSTYKGLCTFPRSFCGNHPVIITNALPTMLSNSSTAFCDCLLGRPLSSRIQVFVFYKKPRWFLRTMCHNEATLPNSSILTIYSPQVAINRYKHHSQPSSSWNCVSSLV